MATREGDRKFDWNKTWVADMLSSVGEDGSQPAAQQLTQLSPEARREREIKAGVITASVGIGLMILLFVLMNGIVATGRVSDAAAEILMRLWIVGVVPLLIGGALIFNGVFITRRVGELGAGSPTPHTKDLDTPASAGFLPPPDTNDLATPIPFSVTDRTTRHLEKKPRNE